jgi:dTDP-4-amino-4,6-dideoxygalactose transaminase
MGIKRNIPFFNYPALFRQYEKAYLRIIQNVLKKGAYIMQEELRGFEDHLASFLNVKHAIGAADGTMALLMSLMASGIGEGDEVIVPSHTFIASVASIHHAGANPVLADCGMDHLIHADAVKKKITAKTRGLMPVHLNGRTANMDRLMQIAAEEGLVVIEDACQALGAKYKNTFAGTFGTAAAFSFYPSKTLGCFGDGGAVVTNDDAVAEKIRLIRDHGRGEDGNIYRYGFNARLDNLQAAVLDFKLDHYEQEISKRRELALHYHNNLMDVANIELPPPPTNGGNNFDIFQNYEIETERRDELRSYLKENGIGTILQWGGYTIHQIEAFKFPATLPYTDRMTRRFMLLPMNTSLNKDDIDYISEKVIEFHK